MADTTTVNIKAARATFLEICRGAREGTLKSLTVTFHGVPNVKITSVWPKGAKKSD